MHKHSKYSTIYYVCHYSGVRMIKDNYTLDSGLKLSHSASFINGAEKKI